eukprot:169443_1
MMQAAYNCNKLLLQILIIARITNSVTIPEYVHVTDKKSWFEADAYCLSEYQSNLASIHNTEENTAVSHKKIQRFSIYVISVGLVIVIQNLKEHLSQLMVHHMIIPKLGVQVVLMVMQMIVWQWVVQLQGAGLIIFVLISIQLSYSHYELICL